MNTTTLNNNNNNGNVLQKIKTPPIFYAMSAIIVVLIICMFLIIFDVNFSFSSSSPSKSQQELVGEIFIVLFFCLLLVGICVLFLPNLKEFKTLFEQIGNVTYVILYTIFFILFYTMMSPDIINDYSYIINPAMLGLGGFSFFKASADNYIEKFNVNYERIKMLILLFCLITIIITFYNINPGGSASKYFGYSLLLTIIISVFIFLYVVILMTLGTEENKQAKNLLSNFSSFGSYGTILFMIFLIGITAYISYNGENFFENKEKSAGIIILVLIISILWLVLLAGNLFGDVTNNAEISNKMNLFKRSLLFLFGLIISGLIIFWITYNIENLSGNSTSVSFILNMLLVAVILGLIYKTINVQLPAGNAKKNAFFSLIMNIIFYIPCILGGAFDWVGKQSVGEDKSQQAGSFLMLALAVALFIAYLKTPSVFNYVSTQGGNQLVNRPVYTDTEYNLGSYTDLNGDDGFDYQYAISCWVYIDSAPPNTNENYTRFTSLLNFGNKPNILYNASKRTLMVTMQQKNLQDITNNKLIDFDEKGNRILYLNNNFLLQKWNNIIINYSGGTLDIFLNGKLVRSSIEVVPYYSYDNLTIGENEGIKGGICNVVYFRKPLTSTNVYYLYNTVKDRTPPVLNDSNETILTKNINKLGSSTSTVVEKI